jgi:hypothetical protein
MGRRKKYQYYTDSQLKELATLSTRKELRSFSRTTKHSYASVYAYWRKLTGKRLTDIDPTVKLGKPLGSKTVRANDVYTTPTVIETEGNTIYVPIKSISIMNYADGVQRLVITY